MHVFQYVEKKDCSGKKVLEMQSEKTLGFCPDLTPDLQVGVAMEGLLVGSQDLAHDLGQLRSHHVTHILSVAYGIPPAFPTVRIIIPTTICG